MKTWQIVEYSRYEDRKWQTRRSGTAGGAGALTLVLQSHQLLVIEDAADGFLESLSLTLKPGTIRGCIVGGALVIQIKTKTWSRKFRIRFYSPLKNPSAHAMQAATDCVSALRAYFQIDGDTPSPLSQDDTSTQLTTLPQMLQKVLEVGNGAGAVPFQSETLLSSNAYLEEAVGLCLLDPSFPAFVSSVAECLKSIAGTSSTTLQTEPALE